MSVQVSDFDRFSFTLFMALAAHAIFVLGITFAPEPPVKSAQTMEITLAQEENTEAPDKADFLAQVSQQGSGDQSEVKELTSPDQPVAAVEEDQPQTLPQPQASPQGSQAQQTVVETTAASPQKSTPDAQEMGDDQSESVMEKSLEMAALEARYEQQRQIYAKRPKVMRVTALSTLQSDSAWYVRNWIEKVTRVGNLNYPAEARQNQIRGTLQMLVSLRKDGSIKEISILESSGSRLLDDAAIRIVRLAAPFPPFPEAMKKNVDELEIIRTWSFQRRGLRSG